MHDRWRLAAVVAALVIIPALLVALGGRLDPFGVHTEQAYTPPGAGAPFGTDSLGRDMAARTLYATGLSLRVAFQSMGISFILAVLLGGLAGYFPGRWPDRVVSGAIAMLFTVPFILIVIAVFAVATPSLARAYVVIGLIGWAAPARLVRAEVIRVRSMPYVLAARAYGFSERSILLHRVLPLCLGPAVVSLLYFLPELLGIEVGLSFFGLGAPPPTPTLGALIYGGLSEFATGWWLAIVPAGVLLMATVVVNMLQRILVRERP
jgi:peptide/nickel transport system permease protein